MARPWPLSPGLLLICTRAAMPSPIATNPTGQGRRIPMIPQTSAAVSMPEVCRGPWAGGGWYGYCGFGVMVPGESKIVIRRVRRLPLLQQQGQAGGGVAGQQAGQGTTQAIPGQVAPRPGRELADRARQRTPGEQD